MKDSECVDLLQWALPQLCMRWPGFQKVRGQVCKRIDRRLRELDLADLVAYRTWLRDHVEEWRVLDSFCRISISRFFSDPSVFAALERSVLPDIAKRALARGDHLVRCWSAGCASGEEPYSLALLWKRIVGRRFPSVSIHILATDADETLLARARTAQYRASSLKSLPEEMRSEAFTRSDHAYLLSPELQANVEFLHQDIRVVQPDGPFDLILCRNLVFTYFDLGTQIDSLAKITERLVPGGYLVIGIDEFLPDTQHGLVKAGPEAGIYRRARDIVSWPT